MPKKIQSIHHADCGFADVYGPNMAHRGSCDDWIVEAVGVSEAPAPKAPAKGKLKAKAVPSAQAQPPAKRKGKGKKAKDAPVEYDPDTDAAYGYTQLEAGRVCQFFVEVPEDNPTSDAYVRTYRYTKGVRGEAILTNGIMAHLDTVDEEFHAGGSVALVVMIWPDENGEYVMPD